MDADSGYDTTNFQALRHELKQLNARVTRRGRVRRGAALDPSASAGAAKPSAAKRVPPPTAAALANPAHRVETHGVKATATKSKVKRASKVTGASKAKPEVKTKPETKAKSAPKDRKTAATQRPRVKAADKGKARARRLLTMLGRISGDDSSAVPGTDFTEAGVVRLLAHLRKRLSQTSPFLVRLQRVLSRPVAMGVRTSAGVSVERLQLVSRQLQDIETLGWARFQEIRAARRGKHALPSLSTVSAVPQRPGTPQKHQAKAAVPESQ